MERQGILTTFDSMASHPSCPDYIAAKAADLSALCNSAVHAGVADGQLHTSSLILGELANQISRGDMEAVEEFGNCLCSPMGITEHEFEQAHMMEAITGFCTRSTKNRSELIDHMNSIAGGTGFRKLVSLLQGVLACNDTLPLYRMPTEMKDAGDGLSALLHPLRVKFEGIEAIAKRGTYQVLSPAVVQVGCSVASQETGDVLAVGTEVEALETVTNEQGYTRIRCRGGWVSVQDMYGKVALDQQSASPIGHHTAMFEPIVNISEVETYLMQHIKITNPEHLQYCHDLVGCRIEEKSDGARDTWQEAYVVAFDTSTNTHTLLYESPSNSNPLKSRNLATRTHRAISARCARAPAALEAERYATAAPKPKKKSGWSLFGAKPEKKEEIGTRVAGLSKFNMWFPGTVVDSDKHGVTIVYDYGCDPEKIQRTRIMPLQSQEFEASADIQWQYLDSLSGWVGFDTQASMKLEFAITNGSHGTGIARGLSLLVVDFRAMTVRDQSTGVDKRIRRTVRLFALLAPCASRSLLLFH